MIAGGENVPPVTPLKVTFIPVVRLWAVGVVTVHGLPTAIEEIATLALVQFTGTVNCVGEITVAG